MRHIIAIAIAITFTTLAAAQDLNSGLEAYKREDYAAALVEWKPLAEQGDSVAQYNLGVMYRNGQGVTRDSGEALKWLRRSARQGELTAQNYLATLYKDGNRWLQDYVLAHMWFNIAAVNGNATAHDSRNELTRSMTREQVAKAQRLARGWMKKHAK